MTKPLTAEERVVEALRAELRDVKEERDALRLEADGHRAARDSRTGERDDMYIALRDVTAERDALQVTRRERTTAERAYIDAAEVLRARFPYQDEEDIQAAIEVGYMVEKGASTAMKKYVNEILTQDKTQSTPCCSDSNSKCCG